MSICYIRLFILFQNGNVFNSLAKIRLDVMDGFNEALNIAHNIRLHILCFFHYLFKQVLHPPTTFFLNFLYVIWRFLTIFCTLNFCKLFFFILSNFLIVFVKLSLSCFLQCLTCLVAKPICCNNLETGLSQPNYARPFLHQLGPRNSWQPWEHNSKCDVHRYLGYN